MLSLDSSLTMSAISNIAFISKREGYDPSNSSPGCAFGQGEEGLGTHLSRYLDQEIAKGPFRRRGCPVRTFCGQERFFRCGRPPF